MLIDPDETATSGNFANNNNNMNSNQPTSSYFNNKIQDFQNNSNDQIIAANGHNKTSDYDNKVNDLTRGNSSNVTVRRGDPRSAGPSTSSSNSSNLSQLLQQHQQIMDAATSPTSPNSLSNQGSNLKNVIANLINNASEIQIEIVNENDEIVPNIAGKLFCTSFCFLSSFKAQKTVQVLEYEFFSAQKTKN